MGSGGHLFVTRGDLTKIACDAWLVPTDAGFGIRRVWRRAGVSRPSVAPEEWGNEGVRVARFGPAERPEEPPEPWLVNVGGNRKTPTEWFMEGVRQFVAEATAAYQGSVSSHGRERHLLALPVVGVGAGGAGALKGDVVQSLIRTLLAATTQTGSDVVLVTHDGPALAAQSARRQVAAEGLELWPELNPVLREAAERLA